MKRSKTSNHVPALVALLFVFATLSVNAQDFVPPETMSVPDGFEVQLWAKTPQLRNPTNIDIDANGHVWVTEAINYRGNNIDIKYPDGDQVVVLADRNNDGRADAKKVFAQQKNFISPLGVTVFGNRIFVSCSPFLWEFHDRNGNDQFDPGTDKKRKFMKGFGGKDHDHSLHEISAGPGGKLYFNVGNAGPHKVTDRGGWTFRSGSFYKGGAGLKSDDGRVWVGGVALRMNPDGTNMRPIGHNFRNSYDQAVTSFGNVFQNDNDDDGDDACRTAWLLRYGSAGYASLDGKRHWSDSRQPGIGRKQAHWRQNTPGMMPAGDIYGHGSPTGITVYENGPFPKEFRGAVLSAESVLNKIFAYKPQQKGAGYAMNQRMDLLTSRKKNSDGKRSRWFRPSDVAIGPSGAIYVADWFDPGVGGHNMSDQKARGAIYRIVPEGTNPQPPEINTSTLQGQINLLKNPAPNVRVLGFYNLVQRGESAIPALKELLDHENPYIAARAIWVLAKIGNKGTSVIENKVLNHSSARMRVAGYRALEQTGHDLARYASRLVDDPSPAVRRTVALSLRDVPFDKKSDLLLTLLENYDSHDRWYIEALGTAAEGKEEAFYNLVKNRKNIGSPLTWSDEFADLAWRLHPASAVRDLFRRANARSISLKERKRFTLALSTIETKQAALAVQRLAGSGPEDLQDYASWWLNHRLDNKWSGFDLKQNQNQDGKLTIAGVDIPTPAIAQTDVLTPDNPNARISTNIQGANQLFLVTTDAGDGNTADWTDWIDPVVITESGKEIDLTKQEWEEAHSGWGKPRLNKNVDGGSLRVGGDTYDRGIGIHAPSVIVYDLSDVNGVTFRATVGLDHGGTSQDSSSARFQVHGQGMGLRDHLRVLRDSGSSTQEKTEAAISLAQSSEGGKALLNLARNGQLPEQTKKQVARYMHRNPSDEVRASAGEYFPRASGNKNLPSIEKIASMDADPEHGKELFYGKGGCAVCHSVNGKGGNVGPALSAIGRKFGRPMMLDAMINPSAGISFGYHAETITTTGGNSITGIPSPSSGTVKITDAGGNTHTFSKEEIKHRTKLDRSLMPSAANTLSAQELVDVAAYLGQQEGNNNN